jgi:hypothetical protein
MINFALIRIRSLRAPYRRAGFEFGAEPLVLGPEHFADGLAGAKALLALFTDPVLKVSGQTGDGEFEPFTGDDVAQLEAYVAQLEDQASREPAPDPPAPPAEPAPAPEPPSPPAEPAPSPEPAAPAKRQRGGQKSKAAASAKS